METRHVSGSLDVEALMRSLNRFVRRSGDAIGGATGQEVPAPLSAEDIEQVAEVVRDPTFDVYVGKEDEIIRRVSGRIEFEVPEADREGLGGLESGTLTFAIELSDVNGDQEIEAPANARPLSDLTDSLGGRRPGRPRHRRRRGRHPGGARRSRPAQPAGGSDGGTADAEAFRQYSECLDKARPEDTGRATGVRRPAASPSGPSRRRRRLAQVALGVDSPARASSACSGPSGQRSACSSPWWSGVAPLSSIEPVLSPSHADLHHLLGRQRRLERHARPARRAWLDRLGGRPASWISVGATQRTVACDRFQAQASCSGREPVARGDRPQRVELLAPRLHPAVGAKAAVVALSELVPG